MLRILIAATVLLLISATSAGADSADESRDSGAQLRIGMRPGGASNFVRPAGHVRATSNAMQRTINDVALTVPDDDGGMLGFFDLGDESEVAVSVSDSVSLGVGYEYLRREDIHLEVAETGSLRDEYSTHNVVLRARWRF
jgi:opacity protein-like surface antigen